MVYDASNRKDVRKAEKAARLAIAQDREAIRKIMVDSFGRAWMWHKLSAARVFSDPFTGDPLVEAYNKGNRNFGMMLLGDIMLHCPEQYIQMTREAMENERRINDDNDSGSASSDAADTAEHSRGQTTDGGVEGSDSTVDIGDEAGLPGSIDDATWR